MLCCGWLCIFDYKKKNCSPCCVYLSSFSHEHRLLHQSTRSQKSIRNTRNSVGFFFLWYSTLFFNSNLRGSFRYSVIIEGGSTGTQILVLFPGDFLGFISFWLSSLTVLLIMWRWLYCSLDLLSQQKIGELMCAHDSLGINLSIANSWGIKWPITEFIFFCFVKEQNSYLITYFCNKMYD